MSNKTPTPTELENRLRELWLQTVNDNNAGLWVLEALRTAALFGAELEREECARVVDYSMAGCDAGPAVARRIRARSNP